MVPGATSWDGAIKVYYAMQHAGVRPDKKFYACLIAVAGRTGQMDAVFQLLEDMAGGSEGGEVAGGGAVSNLVWAGVTTGVCAAAGSA